MGQACVLKEVCVMPITGKQKTLAKLSLLSVAITVALASIAHAHMFGYRALIAGFTVIAILAVLNLFYQRTKKIVLLVLYELLNAWVVIAFGIINGLWNHGFKVVLWYLHGGLLPPPIAGLFPDALVDNFSVEAVGVATFVGSIFAAYYALKLVSRKDDVPIERRW